MRYASSGGGVRVRRRRWAGVLLVGAAVCLLMLVYAYGHYNGSTKAAVAVDGDHGSGGTKQGHHASKPKHHTNKKAHGAAPLDDGIVVGADAVQHQATDEGGAIKPLHGAEGRAAADAVAPPLLVGEPLEGNPAKASTIAPDVDGSGLAKKPTAILHTDHGDITWELFPDDAPKTVANFVRMSREGVFNKSCFYRYEKGFVLQGGLHCNKPPPHHGKAKNVPLEYKRRNEKYTVALARAGGDLNSGGTEFFINLRDNSGTLGPGKKGGYAVFAAVVDGMDTIVALKKLPTKVAGLTRFVSPQPQILFIEIQHYTAPASGGGVLATHDPAPTQLQASGGGGKRKEDGA